MTTAIILRTLSSPVVEDLGLDVWNGAKRIIGDDDPLIEIVYLTDDDFDGWHLAGYVDEEGICKRLPLNRSFGPDTGLYGTVVVVCERIDRKGNTEYRNINPEDLAFVHEIDRMLIPLFEIIPERNVYTTIYARLPGGEE